MEKTSSSNIQLPPGFRFHPSDEELIMHYLINKAALRPVPANIIAEVELYKFNPWELPEKAVFGEEEWYFFTPRDRKYPNGRRPNRMAVSGYWKATGTDKPIFSSGGGKVIGLKKALVFYKGKPPKGSKTEWIMHEYRLPQNLWNSKKKWSMRLDDWVLCRVWRKTSMYESRYDHTNEPQQCYSTGKPYFTDTTPKLKLTDEDHLFKDCPMLPFLCEDTKITAASSILQLKPEVDNNSPWYDLFNSLNKKQFEGNTEEGLTQKEEQVPFALGEDNTIGHISSSNIEQLQLQNFNANYWDPTNPYS